MVSKQLVYNEFGKPSEVIQLQSNEIQPLTDGQALIEMKYANINPSDFGMIGGSYGKLKQLPAIGGREGVGEIVEVKGNSTLKAGDLVRMPETLGTWQTHVVADANSLYKIPEGIGADQAATMFINPTTAWMLLQEYVDLNEGDWIIQNAGNSQVGTWVTQFAKAKGIKTISLVRRESLKDELMALGAEAVLVDDDDAVATIKELTKGNAPKLALNSIGGKSVNRLIKVLGESGVCVTFGGMVGDPIRFPTRFLIFSDIQLRGFWMDKWVRTHTPEQVTELFDNVILSAIENGLKTPIQGEFSLENYSEALKAFQEPRMGKILLKNQ